jgi:radical SAM protein with 4Fe4S-binding SPASM domain
VAFARLVPHGAGAALRDELLTAAEWGAAQVTMVEAARRRGVALVRRDPTFGVLDGPLDATSCGAAPVGGCAAGLNGLTVEPDGTVLPCRRLPIAIGNVFESDLDALWASPVLETLRDRDRLEGACGRCARRWSCGGCRAVAHAVHGRLMAEDPQCPARAPWPSRAAADARRRWYRFLRDNG